MQDFSSSRKNMFLFIREGNQKTLFTVQRLHFNIAVCKADVDIFEFYLRESMKEKQKPRNRRRRGRMLSSKRRCGAWYRSERTPGRKKRRGLPKHRRGLDAHTQKRCSWSWQREWAKRPFYATLGSASNLTKWAS